MVRSAISTNSRSRIRLNTLTSSAAAELWVLPWRRGDARDLTGIEASDPSAEAAAASRSRPWLVTPLVEKVGMAQMAGMQ